VNSGEHLAAHCCMENDAGPILLLPRSDRGMFSLLRPLTSQNSVEEVLDPGGARS
jgi:ectoine hydroxylase-related dioxygenase (phytanoyl-CoA dioxygenase family)